MSILTKNFISVPDTTVAVALYNDIRTTLEQFGWQTVIEQGDTTPGYWWRHPDHRGTFSMSAAHGQWRLDRRLDQFKKVEQ